MKSIIEFLKESLVVESSIDIKQYLSQKFDDEEDFAIKMTNSNRDKVLDLVEKMAKQRGYESFTLWLDEKTQHDEILGSPFPIKDKKTGKINQEWIDSPVTSHIKTSKRPLVVFACDKVKDVDPNVWNALIPVFHKHQIGNDKFDNMIVAVLAEDFSGLSKLVESRLKPIYEPK
jgi:hypothetical protein